MTLAQIERRVASLERKLAALSARDQGIVAPDMNAWIDEIHGTFKHDASYRRAARLGRQWRKSGQP